MPPRCIPLLSTPCSPCSQSGALSSAAGGGLRTAARWRQLEDGTRLEREAAVPTKLVTPRCAAGGPVGERAVAEDMRAISSPSALLVRRAWPVAAAASPLLGTKLVTTLRDTWLRSDASGQRGLSLDAGMASAGGAFDSKGLGTDAVVPRAAAVRERATAGAAAEEEMSKS